MRILLSSAIVVLGMMAATAHADTGNIKYRGSVMKAIGGHMSAAGVILKGEGGSPAHLQGHGHALAELAKVALTIFPEGTGPDAGKTEAKANIWTDKEGFSEVQQAFVTLAGRFAEAAATGDMSAAGAALGALGKGGCKACHDKYRQKK